MPNISTQRSSKSTAWGDWPSTPYFNHNITCLSRGLCFNISKSCGCLRTSHCLYRYVKHCFYRNVKNRHLCSWRGFIFGRSLGRRRVAMKNTWQPIWQPGRDFLQICHQFNLYLWFKLLWNMIFSGNSFAPLGLLPLFETSMDYLPDITRKMLRGMNSQKAKGYLKAWKNENGVGRSGRAAKFGEIFTASPWCSKDESGQQFFYKGIT